MVIINAKAEVHAYWDRPAIQQRTETIGLLGKAGAFARVCASLLTSQSFLCAVAGRFVARLTTLSMGVMNFRFYVYNHF